MIHTRRLVTFLLGVWVSLGVSALWVPQEMLSAWSYGQIIVAVLLLLVILFGTTAGKVRLGFSALLLVLALTTVAIHHESIEAAKVVVGLILTGTYLAVRTRKRRSPGEIDPVDYADHRHIDR